MHAHTHAQSEDDDDDDDSDHRHQHAQGRVRQPVHADQQASPRQKHAFAARAQAMARPSKARLFINSISLEDAATGPQQDQGP